MSWVDHIKDAILTDAPEGSKSVTASPVTHASAVDLVSTMPIDQMPGAPLSVTAADDSQFYTTLKQRTNPEDSPVYAQLLTLSRALESYIPDKAIRFRAAIDQARASNVIVSYDSIDTVFHEALSKLEAQKTTFRTQADNQLDQVVKAKQLELQDITTKIEDMKQKISELESRKQNLSSQIDVTKSKLYMAGINFESAYNRRKAELNKEWQELVSPVRGTASKEK